MKHSEDKKPDVVHNDMAEYYELDYTKAKPNRFAPPLSDDSVMVVLDPDVAAVFSNSEAINRALRALITAMEIIENNPTPEKSSRTSVHLPQPAGV